MKNTIKGITLTLFSTLILMFVAYRSGYFGGMKSSFSASPNGSALYNQVDTIPKGDTLNKIELISASKEMIIIDPATFADSSKAKPDTDLKIHHLIHSSKVGIILKPEDLRKVKPDSTIIDTSKN